MSRSGKLPRLSVANCLLALGLCLSMISGCSPWLSEAARPTPQVILVAYTPAMAGWQPLIATCAGLQPEIALSLQASDWPAPDPAAYDLLLLAAEPPADFPGYAADLGQVELVFVQAAGDTGQTWSREKLLQAYTESGQPSFALFSYALESEMGAPLAALLAKGRTLSPFAQWVADPAGMQASLRQNPGALGYLPGANLPADLAILPGSPTLSLPQVALANAEPQGALRVLLACLQAGAQPPLD